MTNANQPLGVVSATTLVAASMIGVGVYTTSGFTLDALGTPGRVIVAWIAGGVIAICGAIGYGSLANRFSESGGEYLFLSKTLHPVAGLMAGWVSMLWGFTGAIAIAAMGLETYVTPMLPASWGIAPNGSIAISAVIVTALLHTIGVRSAARIQDLVVGLKLLMIGGFIVIAIFTFDDWQGLPFVTDSQQAGSISWLSFANQLVWISFSYAGFNAAVYVSSEVIHPEQNVPRALVAGTILVTLIYVGLNAIFVLAPTVSQITRIDNIDQIAATAATAIGGVRFEAFVRLVIVVSLLTSVSALVMTGPRVYAKMADDGFLPSWFRFEHRPPVSAIWFQAGLAILAISISTLKDLLGFLGLTLSICSALTVSMLFVVRRRERLPLPWLGIPPAIYVISTLVLAVLYGISNPTSVIVAAATLLVGMVLYPWIDARPDPSKPT